LASDAADLAASPEEEGPVESQLEAVREA